MDIVFLGSRFNGMCFEVAFKQCKCGDLIHHAMVLFQDGKRCAHGVVERNGMIYELRGPMWMPSENATNWKNTQLTLRHTHTKK